MNLYVLNCMLCTYLSACLATTFSRTASISDGYTKLSNTDRHRVTTQLQNPSSNEDVMFIFRSQMEKLMKPLENGVSPVDSEFDSVESRIALPQVETPMRQPDNTPGFDDLSSNDDAGRNMMPVDIDRIKLSPSSAKLVHRCRRGMIPDDQATWNESNCVTCTCKSARVFCEQQECPVLKCDEVVFVEGECCPECPKKICQADDGRKFEDEAEWHMDDCTFCECKKGKVLCSVEDCQIPHCENPVKVPGQCCPICLDSSCHAFNGTRISAEEVWKEGVCTHCYCAGGERKCAHEKCPFVNCTDGYIPDGKCCHICRTGVTDCAVSDWANWNECPVQECGGGMRRRYRGVLVPHRNGGTFCPHLSEAEMCRRLPCDVLPFCPVTEWVTWGACTSTCGNGRKMRSRTRAPTNKATVTSLIDCSTTHLQETSHCYEGACIVDEKHGPHESPVYEDDCYNVTWTEWSECSKDCGMGVQRRHQVLANGFGSSGHLCHLLDETRKCHRHNCLETGYAVIRCKLSQWGQWTPCSQSCGSGGLRTRYRTILRGSANGRRPCGRQFVTKPCRTKPCHQKDEFYNNDCRSDDGRRNYVEGEHWLPTPCVSCRCRNSQRQCEKISCDRPNCERPIRLPGLCCEFCSK